MKIAKVAKFCLCEHVCVKLIDGLQSCQRGMECMAECGRSAHDWGVQSDIFSGGP